MFRGGPDTYTHQGTIRSKKWFGLPDGRYYVVGCNDGGYKYLKVFPAQNYPDKSSLESARMELGIELDPIELEIRDRRIRLPLNFRSHMGAIGDRFRVIMAGKLNHFDIWRYYEFLKYGRLDLYDPIEMLRLER